MILYIYILSHFSSPYGMITFQIKLIILFNEMVFKKLACSQHIIFYLSLNFSLGIYFIIPQSWKTLRCLRNSEKIFKFWKVKKIYDQLSFISIQLHWRITKVPLKSVLNIINVQLYHYTDYQLLDINQRR